MEASGTHKIGLLGEDRYFVESVIQILRGWGLDPRGFTNFESAIQYIMVNRFDILLLDSFISDAFRMPRIVHAAGDAKIIVMADSKNMDAAIEALKLGAFDLIEKPIRNELLSHSVSRAFIALAKEREVIELSDKLNHSHSQLVVQQQRIESMHVQLLDTNKALAVFVQNMQRERDEIEKRTALKLRSIILPVLAKLKNSEALQEFKSQFDMLILQIEDMTSGFAVDSRVAMILSSAEMRVASLIKNGATTEKIAANLRISENTVRTHRKNIRRKLKIGTQYSLRNFLNSRIGQARRSGE